MEPNIRAPTEVRPSGIAPQEHTGVSQPPPRPALTRVDSRSNLPLQQARPVAPPQNLPRTQFQPGGPVNNPIQFAPRPGAPPPRGPAPLGPPNPQQNAQNRPLGQPQRPFGPQSFAPQQGQRPQQLPIAGQSLQRAPPPNNLQFGPRQPPQFPGVTTPDGSRAQPLQSPNGVSRNGSPFGTTSVVGQLPRQSSQGSLKGFDQSNPIQNKLANLDYQSVTNENQNAVKAENGIETPGAPKGRSYSIAAAPGAPSPFKVEDDRRKSISSLGGKLDDFNIRTPGLGLIQEGKVESKDNVRGSKDSVHSETSNEGRENITERPESRLSGSKMTESFIGSLANPTVKKKLDDDDDVVLQNNPAPKNVHDTLQKTNKIPDMPDRSPSLTRSDDSPEPKQAIPQNPVLSNKPNPVQEAIRPKTPKSEEKSEYKSEHSNDSRQHSSVIRTSTPSKSIPDPKPAMPLHKPPTDLNVSDSKRSTPRKSASAKARPKDGDNDSGVDESTQGNDLNGSPGSPNKKIPTKLPTKEKSSSSIKPGISRSSSKSAACVKTPETPPPSDKKRVPMNKVQVGNAPSPNIKAVKSKIGSLDNATYKPGGGKVKIENRKLEFKAAPKIAAKNETYCPSGGSKKITTTKLEWNAKSKIGSLQNSTYKPGGGDKKIETVKLDFKDKAKPKVGSTANLTHKPGGGAVKFIKWATPRWRASHKHFAFHALWRKIENQKLEFKAQSKVGSMDNVKHRPGGGEIKIFDDKDYIKQVIGHSPAAPSSTHSRQESPVPPSQTPKSDENLNQQQ